MKETTEYQLGLNPGHLDSVFNTLTAGGAIRNEPVHEKTNDLGSDQVRHKRGCTVTEDG